MPHEQKRRRDREEDDEKEKRSTLEEIAKSLERVEQMLLFLPDGVVKGLRDRIATLRKVLLEQRPPALVLVGRRGAGKSSLVNALFGEKVAELGHVTAQTGRGRWFDVKGPTATLSVLDTRGVQEGSAPAEGDEAATPIESILVELKTKAPDAVVFLVKASEVDAAIDGDLDALETIVDEVERMHGHRVPIVALATHCDLLEPKGTRLHAADEEQRDDVDEKKKHVTLVERALQNKLRARGRLQAHVNKVLGVSTYMSWRADGTLRSDERWRIDDAATALFAAIPSEGRGMFVRMARVQALQENVAETLTAAVAAICAGIAVVPIPVADLVPITALQVTLVASIAWLAGRPLDAKAAGEFLGAIGVNVGAGFALREGARALIKYVFPGAGSAVSGAVAFAGTLAIGAAARAYFIRGEPIGEVRKIWERRGKR